MQVPHAPSAQRSDLNSASTVGPRDTNAYSISPAGIARGCCVSASSV